MDTPAHRLVQYCWEELLARAVQPNVVLCDAAVAYANSVVA